LVEQNDFLNFEDLHGDRLDLINLKNVVNVALSDIHEWSTNPKFFEYLEFPPSTNIDETKKQVDRMLDRMDKGDHYWCIKLKDKEKFIGTYRVLELDIKKKMCAIGYGINPEFGGQGYAIEASRMVFDYLFKKFDIYKVSTHIYSTNIKSIKLAEKIGFKREGLLRKYYLDYRGNRHDCIIVGLFKDEYIAAKKIWKVF